MFFLYREPISLLTLIIFFKYVMRQMKVSPHDFFFSSVSIYKNCRADFFFADTWFTSSATICILKTWKEQSLNTKASSFACVFSITTLRQVQNLQCDLQNARRSKHKLSVNKVVLFLTKYGCPGGLCYPDTLLAYLQPPNAFWRHVTRN